MEINNVDSDGRMCNCCKCHDGIRQDLSLGCVIVVSVMMVSDKT